MNQKTWRDVLPVHPASELFPMVSDVELDELGSDIKEHGLRHGVVFWRSDRFSDDYFLLDGRNRLEAMERAGVPFVYSAAEDGYEPVFYLEAGGGVSASCEVDVDPYEYVLSANIHRRHLTTKQLFDIVTAVLKAQPEKSNRRIAKQVKVDHKTVGKTRATLEGRGEIPHVGARTDTKGRKQPATKPKKATPEKPKKHGITIRTVHDPDELDELQGKRPTPSGTPSLAPAADAQASGSKFAVWVAAKAGGVEQLLSELAQARPDGVDTEALVALDRLGTAAYELSKVAGDVAVASRLAIAPGEDDPSDPDPDDEEY